MKLINKLQTVLEKFTTSSYKFLKPQEVDKLKIPSRYSDNEQAMIIIKDVIADMGQEVAQSLAGSRSTAVIDNPDNGQGMFKAVNTMVKSTFPPFFSEAGFKDKKSFIRAVKLGKGKPWVRIALRAILRLEHGTDPRNQHNKDVPDNEFMGLISSPLPF